MDYTRLTDAQLAGFAKNVVSNLAAHEIGGIPDTVADALVAEVGPVSVEFDNDIEEGLQLKAQMQALNARKRSRRAEILRGIVRVKKNMRAAGCTETEYKKLGFTYRRPWTPVTAQTPAKLSVAGLSHGVNVLTFTGNNERRVTYEIWRRDGKGAKWAVIGGARQQTFEDKPVTPGQYYEYKIRAIAAKSVSSFSNTAVVYGPA